MIAINRKGEVITLLKCSPDGLSITDLVRILGFSRHTISIILAELRGQNKVEVRKVGMAKLHYWRDLR